MPSGENKLFFLDTSPDNLLERTEDLLLYLPAVSHHSSLGAPRVACGHWHPEMSFSSTFSGLRGRTEESVDTVQKIKLQRAYSLGSGG